MPLRPTDYEFWSQEEQRFAEELIPLILAAMAAGMTGGIMAIPPDLRSLVDFDIYDELVETYLRQFRFDPLAKITETTMKKVIALFLDFGKPGGPQTVEELMDALHNGPLSKNRALLIAITEVTRLFFKSAEFIWLSTGIFLEMEWVTALDERVCPICGPMHGQTTSIGSTWGGLTIPAHGRCRCWSRLVIDPAVIAAIALGFFDVRR